LYWIPQLMLLQCFAAEPLRSTDIAAAFTEYFGVSTEMSAADGERSPH